MGQEHCLLEGPIMLFAVSRLPLDMTQYVFACIELSEETVPETWDGSHVAKEKDVTYCMS